MPIIANNKTSTINLKLINIGTDSKNSNLVEPSKDKVLVLIDNIKKAGIEIREKHNLNRLLK